MAIPIHKEPLSTPESYTINSSAAPNVTESFPLTNNTGNVVDIINVTTNVPRGVTFLNWTPTTIQPNGVKYLHVKFEYSAIRETAEANIWYTIRILYTVIGENKKTKTVDMPLHMDWLPVVLLAGGHALPGLARPEGFPQAAPKVNQEQTAPPPVNTGTQGLPPSNDDLINGQILNTIFIILFVLFIMNTLFF